MIEANAALQHGPIQTRMKQGLAKCWLVLRMRHLLRGRLVATETEVAAISLRWAVPDIIDTAKARTCSPQAYGRSGRSV